MSRAEHGGDRQLNVYLTRLLISFVKTSTRLLFSPFSSKIDIACQMRVASVNLVLSFFCYPSTYKKALLVCCSRMQPAGHCVGPRPVAAGN